MKKTFASKVFASRTFKADTLAGSGVAVAVQPNKGWVASVRKRVWIAKGRK